MSKPLSKINLEIPTLEEDQLITAAAKSDHDTLPLTDEQMGAMAPVRVLRGRPIGPWTEVERQCERRG